MEFLRQLIGQVESAAHRDELTRALAQEKYLEVAGDLVRLLQRARVSTAIERAYKRPKVPRPSVYDHLVELPITHFATTNYDPWLKDAVAARLRQAPRVYTPEDPGAFADLSAGSPPLVLLLHGEADRSATCVLSETDYSRLAHFPAYRKALAALVSMRSLLFIGQSFADPDLRLVLDEWQEIFGTGGATRHWFLGVDLTSLAETRLLERGVMPVEYGKAGPPSLLEPVFAYLASAPGEHGDVPSAASLPPEPPDWHHAQSHFAPSVATFRATTPPPKSVMEPDAGVLPPSAAAGYRDERRFPPERLLVHTDRTAEGMLEQLLPLDRYRRGAEGEQSEGEDDRGILVAFHCPASRYLKQSPAKSERFVSTAALCLPRPERFSEVLRKNLEPYSLSIFDRAPPDMLAAEKHAAARAIASSLVDGFIVAVAVPKLELGFAADELKMSYQTLIGALLLPLLKTHRRQGEDVIRVRICQKGDRDRTLLMLTKSAVAATFRKRGSTEFVGREDEPWSMSLGAVALFAAWTVGRYYNGADGRFLNMLLDGGGDEETRR
jgi:hypothetical protein